MFWKINISALFQKTVMNLPCYFQNSLIVILQLLERFHFEITEDSKNLLFPGLLGPKVAITTVLVNTEE